MKTDTASARITNMKIKNQTKCLKKKLLIEENLNLKLHKLNEARSQKRIYAHLKKRQRGTTFTH